LGLGAKLPPNEKSSRFHGHEESDSVALRKLKKGIKVTGSSSTDLTALLAKQRASNVSEVSENKDDSRVESLKSTAVRKHSGNDMLSSYLNRKRKRTK
jgi:hypothetical protein